MSNIARFPAFNADSYSDDELRALACQAYCDSAGGSNLNRIAKRVSKPVEVIRQWHAEDKWILKRAEATKQKDEKKLAELSAMLDQAGVLDSKSDALDTLKLIKDAKSVARSYLAKLSGRDYVEGLDKVLSAMERIEKLTKSAYARISAS